MTWAPWFLAHFVPSLSRTVNAMKFFKISTSGVKQNPGETAGASHPDEIYRPHKKLISSVVVVVVVKHGNGFGPQILRPLGAGSWQWRSCGSGGGGGTQFIPLFPIDLPEKSVQLIFPKTGASIARGG